MALWGQVPAAKPDPWGQVEPEKQLLRLSSDLHTHTRVQACTHIHMHTQNKCVKNNMKYWKSNIDSTRAFEITMFLKM